MTEPIIICPTCKTEIKLTESLAAPIIEATRIEYEKRLAQKDSEFTKRESVLREREESLSKAKEAIDDQVADKVRQERTKIAAEEAKKAKLELSNDLEQKSKEITDLQEVLKHRDEKLAEAQNAQVELIKKQRELDDAKREFDLTVEKRIQEGLAATRYQARKEAEEQLKLKMTEKEEAIAEIKKQAEEFKHKAEQGAKQLETTRLEYEQRLTQKDNELAKRESSLREREEAISKAKEGIDDQVAEKVRLERTRIAAEEAKKARLELSNDLEQKGKEITDLQEVLKHREEKLAEAQNAQAELIKKQRELDDAKRELELTVQKRIQEGLAATRQEAKKEAEDELNLKVKEKEQTISSMQKQIEELRRKAEQGSQQLQGEVQELELENLLRIKFPFDAIEPVPKGEYGGDVLQRVVGAGGQPIGTILWESKRTKNWSDTWLPKLREDQRTAKAEIAVIVSQVLPKGVETFEMVEGIWVTHPRAALPVAAILRQSLLEVAVARQASEGQQTKTEMIYQYLTGPRFRQRVEAIVEAFSTMQEDLDKERKAIMKQWAKREEQIDRVMQATVGMYGDLQGIAGKSLQEIEGLEMSALGNAGNNQLTMLDRGVVS